MSGGRFQLEEGERACVIGAGSKTNRAKHMHIDWS